MIKNEYSHSKLTKQFVQNNPPDCLNLPSPIVDLNTNFVVFFFTTKHSTMKHTKQDFACNITVPAAAADVFKAICDIPAWWTTDLHGYTHHVQDEFTVAFYGDTFVKFRITEMIPEKKIVWLVTDCYLYWIENKREWTNTQVIWEISPEEHQTHLHMTHEGLIPSCECYASCKEGWNKYVKGSLFQLLTQGKGTPQLPPNNKDFTCYIEVNITPRDAFKMINRVSEWWIKDVEGSTEKINDKFTVRFGNTWKSFKIIELIPDKKIVWLNIDCNLPWNSDVKEWKNTKIIWEISDNKISTVIKFTHVGLLELECGNQCSNAWTNYIQQSLFKFIKEGKGLPNKF
ncbi:SRPBCC family protein [Thermoflavifilum aggregans]|nr:SRPBCC domain-containing protein [Thermoflavifilum aggregans]